MISDHGTVYDASFAFSAIKSVSNCLQVVLHVRSLTHMHSRVVTEKTAACCQDSDTGGCTLRSPTTTIVEREQDFTRASSWRSGPQRHHKGQPGGQVYHEHNAFEQWERFCEFPVEETSQDQRPDCNRAGKPLAVERS